MQMRKSSARSFLRAALSLCAVGSVIVIAGTAEPAENLEQQHAATAELLARMVSQPAFMLGAFQFDVDREDREIVLWFSEAAKDRIAPIMQIICHMAKADHLVGWKVHPILEDGDGVDVTKLECQIHD